MNPAFADGGVLAEPLRRLRLILDDTAQTHVVLVTADDEGVRREAMAELAEQLSGRYRVAELDYGAAPLPSLPRYYRQLLDGEPVCLFAHGLERLAARDPDAYGEALHFLNAHREDLRLAPGAVVLWLDTPTWKDVLEKAPDFADWETGGAAFALPAGRKVERTALGRLPLREAETLRRQVRHIRDMLERPNLRRAMRQELDKQLETAERRLGRIVDLRRDYRLYLMDELREHVLRGFAPQVSGRVLSLPLAKIFLPLSAVGGRPALAEYAEEDLHWQERAAELEELDWKTRREEIEKRRARLQQRQSVQHAFSLEGMLRERRAVLLGDPGSGKTTTARYVTWALAAEDLTHTGTAVRGRLPVLVRLASFAKALEGDRGLTLLDYVSAQLVPRTPFGPMLRQALEAGDCLVILDGLDEVTDPELRTEVTARIRTLVNAYAANRYLVTSRIVGYERTPLTQDFQHATLQELESEDRRRFIALWYQAIGAEIPDRSLAEREAELIEALEKKPQVARLAANPLLLTIMVLMQWRGIKLPSRRGKVYEIATDTLIEYWTAERVELDADEVKQLLAPIAHYILSSNVGGVIARDDLLPRLRAGVAELRGSTAEEAEGVCEELLAVLSEQSGLFLERGLDAQGKPVYGFLHQTFGEYLAALHMASEVFAETFELADYIHRSAWKEPLLLLIGHLSLISQPHANRLLRGILDHDCPYEEILRRNALLAAECLADDVQVAAKLRNEILERLAASLMHEAPQVRKAAAEICGPLGKTRHRGAAVSAVLGRVESKSEIFSNSEIGMALVRLGQRDRVTLDHGRWPWNLSRDLRFYLEGWPEKALSFLSSARLSITVGRDLSQSYFGNMSAKSVQQVLGTKAFNEILEILLAKRILRRSTLLWLKTLASSSPSSDDFLGLLADDSIDLSVRLLAAARLQESGYEGSDLRTFFERNRSDPRTAETLIELKMNDLIDWDRMRLLAFVPDSQSTGQVIHLLLQSRLFEAALPALFLTISNLGIQRIVEDLANAERSDLARVIARWLALRPGYENRYEACEALLGMELIEETIPLLKCVAYECHGEASQKACRRLLMLREVELALPILSQLARSDEDPEVQYEAALSLALVGRLPDGRLDPSRAELKASVLEERNGLFQQATEQLYDAGMAALGQVDSDDPLHDASIRLGQLALTWLCRRGSLRQQTVGLPTRGIAPPLNMHFALFEWRGGHLGKARERVKALFRETDVDHALIDRKIMKRLCWTLGDECSAVLGNALRRATVMSQYWASEILARMMPAGCTREMVAALAGLPVFQKRYAASVLGALRDPETTQPLIDVLSIIRGEAAAALGEIGDPAAVPALVDAYGEASSEQRRTIIQSLGKIGDETGVTTIMTGLRDAEKRVRVAAAESLKSFNSPDVVNALETALSDENPKVRVEAVKSLSALGNTGDHAAQCAVLAALKDQDPGVRGAAVVALGNQPEELRIAKWHEALQDPDLKIRTIATIALLQRRYDQTVLDGVLGTLSSEDPEPRYYAAFTLGVFRVAAAAHPLARLLGEEDSGLRAMACWALARLPQASMDIVLPLLNDFHEEVRAMAACALGRHRETRAYEQLLILLQDPDSNVRGAAAWALGRYGRSDAVEPLMAAVEGLVDKEWLPIWPLDETPSRVAPACSLARLNAAEALPLLVATAVPEREYVKALVHLDPQSALASLDRFVHVLRDESWPACLRGHALWRLGRTREAETLFRGAVATADDAEFVVSLAHFLLEHGNVQEAAGLITQLLARADTLFDLEDPESLVWDRKRALCLLTRALLLKRRGDLAGALEALAEARELDPFVTDLQDLEFDHLWRRPALDDLAELLACVERDESPAIQRSVPSPDPSPRVPSRRGPAGEATTRSGPNPAQSRVTKPIKSHPTP